MKNTAAKPDLWMLLSDSNSIRKILLSEVMTGGRREPQKIPCLRKVSAPDLL